MLLSFAFDIFMHDCRLAKIRVGGEKLVQLEKLVEVSPFLVMLLAAEMFLILTRAAEITIAIKRDSQRTPLEKKRIGQGLVRSLVLEFALFVPISVGLFRVALYPLFISDILRLYPNKVLWTSMMGVSAYEFPYTTVKSMISAVARHSIAAYLEIERGKQGESK